MSSEPSSQKSYDVAGPTCPAPSPYDSNADDCDDCGRIGSGGGYTSSQWSISTEPSSQNSDDVVGSTYPAPSPYDSNSDDSDDVDDCGSVGGGGGDTSPQWTIRSDHAFQRSDDIVTQGSICPAPTPYDSSAADDNATVIPRHCGL